MPDLVPTRATALVYDNGHVCALSQGRSTGAAFTTHDCLILPAPRPIAECPPEWMDGRTVWLYASGSNRWLSAYYDIPGEYWESDDGGLDDRDVTHVMLPPPSPEEANHG